MLPSSRLQIVNFVISSFDDMWLQQLVHLTLENLQVIGLRNNLHFATRPVPHPSSQFVISLFFISSEVIAAPKLMALL